MMIPPILAKLSAHPVFADALNFILTGFVLVIGALLVLSALISVIGKTFRLVDERKKVAAQRSQSSSTTGALPATSSPASATAPASRALSASPASPAAPHTSGGSTMSAPSDENIPLAVLIAAAVHAALDGQAHRVVHIEPVSVGWAREGRREIFSSHRFR